MISVYDIANWYWIVGDDVTKAWSSAECAYVSEWNSLRTTRILNETELQEVLTNAGVPKKGPCYVPSSVFMWQAKIALNSIGKLDLANEVISKSNNNMLITAWEYAPSISRNSPAVAAIAQAIHLTKEEVDALFLAAENIKV